MKSEIRHRGGAITEDNYEGLPIHAAKGVQGAIEELLPRTRRSRPLKVLQVIDGLGMGGAETWLMEVLRLWAVVGGPEMHFLLTGGKRRHFDSEAERLGAKLCYLLYRRSTLVSFIRGFRQLLHEEQYDAIHDHAAYPAGWHLLMGARLLPPVRVVHVHNPSYQITNNYGVTTSRRAGIEICKRLIARYSTHIAGTSRQVLSEYGFDTPVFNHISKRPLYCGIAPQRFLGDPIAAHNAICTEFGWPEDSRIVLFAGRMDQSPDLGHPLNHKNSGFAVAVGLAALARDARFRMLFAGITTGARAVLQSRIDSAGATGKVVFAGIRTDIEHLMLGSNALLFPSRGEGLGMVAVEAQAAGLPVLACSAVPRECVVVESLVRFMPIEAGEDTWAEALLELSAKPRALAVANRAVAASAYSIENSARALTDVYGSAQTGTA
jgi:glycosyltransferase involved in cell wall biosynthesis